MKKIAPTLQQAFPSPFGWTPTGDFLLAKKELRALLAVAGAVISEADEFAAISRMARGAMPGELNGDEVGRRVENIADRLEKKIERLSRASGKGDKP